MSKDLQSEATAPHIRVKRDLNTQKIDEPKIVYNIGEILIKTDAENRKTTTRELRALDFNTGEILKTEVHQNTLEKPKIVDYIRVDEAMHKPTEDVKALQVPLYLNEDDALAKSLGDLKPLKSLDHLSEHKPLTNSTVDLKPIAVASELMDPEDTAQSQELQSTTEDIDDDMQNSVMEIVTKILEKLKGSAALSENSTLTLDGAENKTNSMHIDESFASFKNPTSTIDPILETLNSIADLFDMDYDDVAPNDTLTASARMRTTRQLRHYFSGGRGRFQIQNIPGTHYRSIDAALPYQQQQQPQNTFSFESYNPYLSPPTTVANYNQLSPGYQVYAKPQQQPLRTQAFGGVGGAKVTKYTYTAAMNPPPAPQPMQDDFRPIAANYYHTSTTTARPATNTKPRRPNLFNNPDLIPYILQALREYQEQRKKLQQANFQYFHLENESVNQDDRGLTNPAQYPLPTKKPAKVTANSHFAQFSTVGGFYNNQQQQHTDIRDYKPTVKHPPSRLVSQYSIVDNYIPTTTESNYFKYNLLTNQKIKGYHNAPHIGLPLFSTTLPPPTSNIDIVAAPNLAPHHHSSSTSTTSTKHPKYNVNGKLPESLAYANNSIQMPESYQVFTKVHTSTISPKLKSGRPSNAIGSPHPSRKPALTLQFNVPEFVASLQSSDLANMNPQVVNMIKYFKQINTQKPTRKPNTTAKLLTQQYEDRVPTTTEQTIRQRPTVTQTRRPLKGYEDFIKSIPNQSNKLNTLKPSTSTKTTTTTIADYYDGEYDEADEDESLGTDTDDDIMPPSQMPPYMPMSETMAPPRSQLMALATTTAWPMRMTTRAPTRTTARAPTGTRTPTRTTTPYSLYQDHAKPTFHTGYVEATTTRGPFSNLHFQQFYHTTTTTTPDNKLNDQQIPSFINFPSDIFQEFKQRLPPKPELGSTAPTILINQNNGNHIRFTHTKASTIPTPRITISTVLTKTTTTSPTTTKTTQRTRYTARPNHRQRGQSKFQSNSSGNNNKDANVIVDNDYNKNNKTEFGFRKRPAATPSSSALGSVHLNVNMNLDVDDSGQRYDYY
ncbi:uncharacterized protein [Eurosta solidaginis]|uniref:uncharacterized protein n=1 Tax=Eurosta solidaginis TaxID=178769 RepID=UPI0035309E51